MARRRQVIISLWPDKEVNMAAQGWKQFGIKYISITPQRYTNSLQWQIGRPLTASRLAAALTEDSHSKVSVDTAKKILRKYPPKKNWKPSGKRWPRVKK